MTDLTGIVKHLTDRSDNCFLYQLDKWFGCHLLFRDFNAPELLTWRNQVCFQKDWCDIKKNIFKY